MLKSFSLKITRLGRSSARFLIEGHQGKDRRLTVHLTLVWVEALRAAPWPDDMRARLTAYQESQDAP